MNDSAAFLKEAAIYFRNRDTGGEDRAHWANVFSAERCEKAAAELTRLTAEVAELQANLKSVLDRETAMIGRYDAKLESAERERDAALAEVERVKGALDRIASFNSHYENDQSQDFMRLYPEYEAREAECEETSDAMRLTFGDIARAARTPPEPDNA